MSFLHEAIEVVDSERSSGHVYWQCKVKPLHLHDEYLGLIIAHSLRRCPPWSSYHIITTQRFPVLGIRCVTAAAALQYPYSSTIGSTTPLNTLPQYSHAIQGWSGLQMSFRDAPVSECRFSGLNTLMSGMPYKIPCPAQTLSGQSPENPLNPTLSSHLLGKIWGTDIPDAICKAWCMVCALTQHVGVQYLHMNGGRVPCRRSLLQKELKGQTWTCYSTCWMPSQ